MPLERCETMDNFFKERKSESESFYRNHSFGLTLPLQSLTLKIDATYLWCLGPSELPLWLQRPQLGWIGGPKWPPVPPVEPRIKINAVSSPSIRNLNCSAVEYQLTQTDTFSRIPDRLNTQRTTWHSDERPLCLHFSDARSDNAMGSLFVALSIRKYSWWTFDQGVHTAPYNVRLNQLGV